LPGLHPFRSVRSGVEEAFFFARRETLWLFSPLAGSLDEMNLWHDNIFSERTLSLGLASIDKSLIIVIIITSKTV